MTPSALFLAYHLPILSKPTSKKTASSQQEQEHQDRLLVQNSSRKPDGVKLEASTRRTTRSSTKIGCRPDWETSTLAPGGTMLESYSSVASSAGFWAGSAPDLLGLSSSWQYPRPTIAQASRECGGEYEMTSIERQTKGDSRPTLNPLNGSTRSSSNSGSSTNPCFLPL